MQNKRPDRGISSGSSIDRS